MYTVSKDDPNLADENTETIISSIDWPQFNHNGHWIGFGPDGKLYISTGDGGYANDWGIGHNVTEGNGQDLTTPLGKILRINTDGSRARGQPLRQQPGRAAADLGLRHAQPVALLVRHGRREPAVLRRRAAEQLRGGRHRRAGQNLGWRKMEASHCFNYVEPDAHPAECDKAGITMPIIEYKNCTAVPDGCMGISVTGGFVYRGAHKDWDGAYIFGDWSKSFAERDGQLFMATKGGDGKWTDGRHGGHEHGGQKLPYVLAFAQDAAGEVYALTSVTTGPNGSLDTIYKIVPAQ